MSILKPQYLSRIEDILHNLIVYMNIRNYKQSAIYKITIETKICL